MDSIGTTIGSVLDSVFAIIGNVDATKQMVFQVDTQATASTLTFDVGAQTANRTLTVPVLAGSDTIATSAVANIFTAINSFSNATNAVSAVTGAIVTSGGIGSAKNIFSGGDITASGSSNTNITVIAASNVATVSVDSATGNRAYFKIKVNGVEQYSLSGNTSAFLFADSANAYNPLTYTKGSISTGYISIQGTLSASSSTVGVLRIGDGSAATNVAIGGGNINAGGVITISKATTGSALLHSQSLNGLLYSTLGNTNANSSANYLLQIQSDTADGAIRAFSSTYVGGAIYQGSLFVGTANVGNLLFGTGNAVTAVLFKTTNNLAIGTTTDNAATSGLHVAGTTDSTSVTTGSGVFDGGLGIAKRSYLGTIGATFKGNVNAGVQDATAAVAGQVGEVLTSTVSGVAVAATGTVGNITSISLTAGDWLISGNVVVTGGATGLTSGSTAKMSVVTTSATNGTSGSTMAQESVLALLANGLFEMAIPHIRVNTNATATNYLTVEVSYVAGSPTVAGTLTATRMR